MGKLQQFVRKNKFFVSLISVLLLIIFSLSVYIVMQQFVEKSNTPIAVAPVEKPTQEDARITEFLGSYNRSSDEVLFHWGITPGKAEIESVYLYHGQDNPINVTSYSTWSLSRTSYGLHTGDNEFTLLIRQANGKEIKATRQVFIKYAVSLEQSIEHKENRTKVTLTYQYQKDHPIKVPKLIMLDDSINYTRKDYIGTTYKDGDDDMVIAKTTYEFLWYENPVEYQQFSIRWAFEDVNDSADFTLEKGKAADPSKESTPEA